MAKWFIIAGVGLILIGLLVAIGLPLGKLPGDFQFKGEKTEVYFPLATSLFISLVLTILLNAFFWFRK